MRTSNWFRIIVESQILCALCGLLLQGCHEGLELEQRCATLYRAWLNSNNEAYERFRELADTRRWKMYALGGARPGDYSTIGRIDFGRQAFEPLYSVPPGSLMVATSCPVAGRVAFIEARTGMTPRHRSHILTNFDLVILEADRAVMRFPVQDERGVNSVVLGKDQALLSSGLNVHLFDMKTRSLCNVFTSGELWVRKMGFLKGRFLLLLVGQYGESSSLRVLESRGRYAQVSTVAEVSNFVVVGDDLIIQAGSECCRYDPESGATEPLASGRLWLSSAEDAFLFRATIPPCLDDGKPRGGPQRVYRFKMSTGSAKLLWEMLPGAGGLRVDSGPTKPYYLTDAIASPDGSFLFFPSRVRSHKALRVFEYEVYDLASGENRGAFLNLVEGKFLFRLLGWCTSGH